MTALKVAQILLLALPNAEEIIENNVNKSDVFVSICEICHIEEKVYQCCGRFPDGGESVPLVLDDGRILRRCPYLDSHGKCSNYTARPLGCRQFYCDAFRMNEGFLMGTNDFGE